MRRGGEKKKTGVKSGPPSLVGWENVLNSSRISKKLSPSSSSTKRKKKKIITIIIIII